MKLLLYCTKAKPYLFPMKENNPFELHSKCSKYGSVNGKIVGECDFKVEEIKYHFGYYNMGDWFESYILEYACLSYKELDDYLLSLGDEVQKKTLMHYIAYRRLKNFASVEIQKNGILVFVKVDADTITLEKGFTRDVRNIGHFGTGQLEITIQTLADLEKAKPLIEKSLASS